MAVRPRPRDWQFVAAGHAPSTKSRRWVEISDGLLFVTNPPECLSRLWEARWPLGQTMDKITKSCIEARELDAYLLVRLTVY
jgi:hypothetical protein